MKNATGTMAALLLAAAASAATAQQPGAQRSSGEQLFDDNCGICHAPGELGTVVLSRRLGKERAVLTTRDDLPADYVRHVVRHGLGGMPPFTRGDVTDRELEAIVGFLTRPDRR